MELEIEVRSKIRIIPIENNTRSRMISGDVLLVIDEQFDRSAYFEKNGLPNKNGYNAIMHTLISGLVNNMHAAEKFAGMDSTKHMEKIISELNKHFVSTVENTLEKTEYKSPGE